jgi:Ca2+-binding RTX toxin-like protein
VEGDSLTGSAYGDWFEGLDGNDTIASGGGNDTIRGNEGDDRFSGEDGDDLIVDLLGVNTIYGGAGNDAVSASGTIYGGDGGDSLSGDPYMGDPYGSYAAQAIYGEAGDDFIGGGQVGLGSLGPNTLDGGTGDDRIYGTNGGRDYIIGGDGNDYVDSQNYEDTLLGGEGNDTLISSDGYSGGVDNSSLSGGAGDDVLRGNGTLDGGEGDDQFSSQGASLVIGGLGDDTAFFNINSGVFTLVRSGDEVHVIRDEYSPTYATRFTGVEHLQFSDIMVDLATAELGEIRIGTTGNDSLAGTAYSDYIDGGEGDDTVAAGDGDDAVYGGLGADSLNGDGGNDRIADDGGDNTIDGGSGDDSIQASGQLQGGIGNDLINVSPGYDPALYSSAHGGVGDDTLYGGSGYWLTRLYGDDGNDSIGGAGTLEGGAGDDRLFGTDSYWNFTSDLVLGGDGNDTISGGSGDNTLDGGAGTDLAYAANESYSRDLASIISLGEGEGYVFVTRSYPGSSGRGRTVETIRNVEEIFLSGTGLVDLTQTGSMIMGTDAADTLGGTVWDDSITGGDGNDTVDGGTGNDILVGGSGDDSLTGGDGGDELNGGTGNDSLYGGGGYNDLSGGEGDDLVQGGGEREVLRGDSGNDTLYAGSSEDTLEGGDGDDVLYARNMSYSRVSGGAGNDTLNLSEAEYGVWFGLGWTYGELEAIVGSNYQDTLGGSYSGDSLWGGLGADSLDGFEGNDSLDGGEGWDTLTGGAGDDTLDGGIDTDQMYGGDGNDRYVADAVGDQTHEALDQGNDTIESSLDWTLAEHVENLVLTGAAATGMGNGLDNRLTGNDGANTLSGGAGNDTLTGGLGADSLLGGSGLDTAIFAGNRADYSIVKTGGAIVVTGADGADTLGGIEYLSFDDETVLTSLPPVLTGDLSATVNFGAAYVLTAADLGYTDADDGAANIRFIVSSLKGGKVMVDGVAVTSFSATELSAGKVAFQHGARLTDTAGFAVSVSDGVSQTVPAAFTVAVNDTAGRVLTGYDAGEAELISLNADGEQANGATSAFKVSADGRYFVFSGTATNLVADGAPAGEHLYRKDIQTGEVVRIDALSDGTVANQFSYVMDMSDDGNLVLFGSNSTNLGWPGIVNGQVFLKNLVTGDVSLVSTLPSGNAGDGSWWGGLTGDGQEAFYGAWSFDAGPGYPDFMELIYVKSLADGTTEALSDFNAPGNWTFYQASFMDATPDGSKILFWSNAPYLVPNDTNMVGDLFVFDRVTDTVSLVSATASGDVVGGTGYFSGFLSNDGTQVIFTSAAAGLTPVDTNGQTQVYVKDLASGAITMISVNAAGQAGNATSGYSGFSADGTRAYFHSLADNLVEGDNNGKGDLFAYELATGIVTRIVAGNGDSSWATAINSDLLVFSSDASDLVEGDTNGATDTFLLHITGNDSLTGGSGNDRIFGKSGDDSLRGEAGSDSLDGGTGNDILLGGARWDTLEGGAGDDSLDGGADNDRMWGGGGNDTYVVDHVGDRVYEVYGEGTDTVRSSISYSLTPDVETLFLTGTAAINGTGNGLHNAINGNSGNNVLDGGLGNDSLYGWAGNDSLFGGNDHDRLSGGVGNDLLVGNSGNDVMGGGAGADRFVFSSVANNGHDHIVDFEHGLDRLVFTGAQYGFAAGHVLTDAEFTVGSAAVGTGAQFIWDAVAQKLYWDADGSGAGAAFELAIVTGDSVTKDDLFFTA